MLTAAQLQSYITQHLACEYIKVTGDDGTHFEAVLVSSAPLRNTVACSIFSFCFVWACAFVAINTITQAAGNKRV